MWVEGDDGMHARMTSTRGLALLSAFFSAFFCGLVCICLVLRSVVSCVPQSFSYLFGPALRVLRSVVVGRREEKRREMAGISFCRAFCICLHIKKDRKGS